MNKKLTNATIRKAKAMHEQGSTFDEIAEKLHLSHGSAVNAVRKVLTTTPTTPLVKSPDDAPEPPEPTAPPTQGELRQWLGEQCRGLKQECDQAKARGDNAAFASLSRIMAGTAQQLARVTPIELPKEEEPPDWTAAAAQGREKMQEQLRRIIEAETETPDAIRATIARHEKRIEELRRLL